MSLNQPFIILLKMKFKNSLIHFLSVETRDLEPFCLVVLTGAK